MRQTIPLEQGDRIAGEGGIGRVHLQMLGTAQHAAVHGIPFSAGFKKLAIMQVGNIDLPLQPLGMGNTTESGGRLPVAVQGLQEILLCKRRSLGFQGPVTQVAVLLRLARLMVQAGIEQGVGFL